MSRYIFSGAVGLVIGVVGSLVGLSLPTTVVLVVGITVAGLSFADMIKNK